MPDKCQRAVEAAASVLSEEACDEGAFAQVDCRETVPWFGCLKMLWSIRLVVLKVKKRCRKRLRAV